MMVIRHIQDLVRAAYDLDRIIGQVAPRKPDIVVNILCFGRDFIHADRPLQRLQAATQVAGAFQAGDDLRLAAASSRQVLTG